MVARGPLVLTMVKLMRLRQEVLLGEEYAIIKPNERPTLHHLNFFLKLYHLCINNEHLQNMCNEYACTTTCKYNNSWTYVISI